MQPSCSILSSQVGYDIGDPMRAIVRSEDPESLPPSATFTLHSDQGQKISQNPLKKWGEKWGSHW